MGRKGFHLVIPSICRSDKPSAFAVPPVAKSVNHSNSTAKRRVSSSTVSLNCGRFRSKPKKHYISYYYNNTNSTHNTPSHKVALSDSDSHVSTSPAAFRKTQTPVPVSNYSAELPLFSSQDISMTYSADSYLSSLSDSGTDTSTTIAHESDSINGTPIRGLILNKKNKKQKRRANKVKRVRSYQGMSRVSPLGRNMMTCNSPEEEKEKQEEEVKMKESLAVMKKSEDPYGDFKRSMMEMIVEKEMFETADLEQLLHCFLSLNSRHHYGAIIEAFSDVWEILFSKSALM